MVVTNLSQLRGALSVVINKSTDKRVISARRALANEIIKDTEDFVPYDTGALSSSATVLNDGKTIAYTADHAEYVNNMPESYNFNRSTHTQATSNWVDASMTLNRDKWLSNFKKRVGGK